MRILHSIHSVNPAVGGPVEVIRQFIPLHIQAGDKVDVVSMDDPNSAYIKEFPGTVHALGPSLLSYGYAPPYVDWLRSRQFDYDVVIVNGLWQYPSVGTWMALHDTGLPYVVFPHGMLDPWFNRAYPLKHLKKALYWPMADYKVLRDAATVFFTAEDERKNAAQSFVPYECDQTVLGCGIAQPEGDVAAYKDAFLNKYPHLRGKEILLFLSRLNPKKGLDLLLRAFAALEDRNASLHLVIVGPDNDNYGSNLKQRFERRLGDSVTWIDMLRGDLKWGAIHSADALVLPSHQENFGVVVAEALACSKPVLISNKVNIWNEVMDERAGYVEEDSYFGTQRLLDRWIGTSREQRQDMQHNARRCFEKHFEIHAVYERLMTRLRQIVDQSSRSTPES